MQAQMEQAKMQAKRKPSKRNATAEQLNNKDADADGTGEG